MLKRFFHPAAIPLPVTIAGFGGSGISFLIEI